MWLKDIYKRKPKKFFWLWEVEQCDYDRQKTNILQEIHRGVFIPL